MLPVLDSGARGATVNFVERGVGDVLLAWENEAFLAVNELGKDRFEIVVRASRSWPSRRSQWSTRSSTSAARAPAADSFLQFIYSRRRPGDRRNRLLPAARSRGRYQARRRLPEGAAPDHRGFRRLAEGADQPISMTVVCSIRSTRSEIGVEARRIRAI